MPIFKALLTFVACTMKYVMRMFILLILCGLGIYLIYYNMFKREQLNMEPRKIHSEVHPPRAEVSDSQNGFNINTIGALFNPLKTKSIDKIVVSVVVCGDRMNEALTMIKSAILFTQASLQFVIIADSELIPQLQRTVGGWRNLTEKKFGYEVLPTTFPTRENAKEWKKLFKLCASQRLFLPTVLKHVDSLLYVDTDVIFLSPVEEIWQHFHKMNSSQIAALVPEQEDPATGWYNRFARHPYYGPLGVNSGVMLMNLTRMRQFGWYEYVVPIYQEYKLKITWGDQDIINIIFHFHPDKLYIFPCRYNFRPDHCMYMSVCKSAEEQGVAVLHGNRGSFHSGNQLAFKAAFTAMEEYKLDKDPYTNLLLPMKNYLEATVGTNCGKVHRLFTKGIEDYFHKKISNAAK